jgi:hypothetical protein
MSAETVELMAASSLWDRINPLRRFTQPSEAARASEEVKLPAGFLCMMCAASAYLLGRNRHLIIDVRHISAPHYYMSLYGSASLGALAAVLGYLMWRGSRSRTISVTIFSWLAFEMIHKIVNGQRLGIFVVLYLAALAYAISGVRATFWLSANKPSK